MNHAGMQSIPNAAAIRSGAIKAMNLDNARAIPACLCDATSRDYRTYIENTLTERMRPLISRAAEYTDVASACPAGRQWASSGPVKTDWLTSRICTIRGVCSVFPCPSCLARRDLRAWHARG